MMPTDYAKHAAGRAEMAAEIRALVDKWGVVDTPTTYEITLRWSDYSLLLATLDREERP